MTLIRWLLALTPGERLKVLESNIRSLGTYAVPPTVAGVSGLLRVLGQENP